MKKMERKRLRIEWGQKLILLFLLAFVMGGATARAEPQPLDQKKLEMQAINGDGDAATRLSRIYRGTGDLHTAEGWSLLAAEDGGAENQYELVHYLLDDHDTDSQLRAIFWMRRALQTADPTLTKYIKLTLANESSVLAPAGMACPLNSSASHTLALNQPNAATELKGLDFQSMIQLRVSALCGEADAARYLVGYFPGQQAYEQLRYFTTIAAEDGDASSELSEAESLFANKSDDEARARAVFWAKRAAASANDAKIEQQAAAILRDNKTVDQ